jgi:hypothetical protein
VAGEAVLGEVQHGHLGRRVLPMFVPIQRLVCLAGQRVAEKVEMPRHLLAGPHQPLGVMREGAECGQHAWGLRGVLPLLRMQAHGDHRREGLEKVVHGGLEAAWRGLGHPATLPGGEEGKAQQDGTGAQRAAPEQGALQHASYSGHHGALLDRLSLLDTPWGDQVYPHSDWWVRGLGAGAPSPSPRIPGNFRARLLCAWAPLMSTTSGGTSGLGRDSLSPSRTTCLIGGTVSRLSGIWS